MVYKYFDNSIPYPDAKVVAVLCVGDAIKYVVRKGCQVPSQLILTNISVNIAKIFPRETTVVPGTSLLQAYYDDETSQLLPQPYVDKIEAKIAQSQGTLESNENPVKKRK